MLDQNESIYQLECKISSNISASNIIQYEITLGLLFNYKKNPTQYVAFNHDWLIYEKEGI